MAHKTIEIIKSSSSYRGYSGKLIRHPLWIVLVDGKVIIGDCDHGFATLRAARAAIAKLG